ncbi:MAG TPA: hypothetical protein VN622_02815 [Clostridia bacterium]|nr:hypothetical protein [Clostridia bacterium]
MNSRTIAVAAFVFAIGFLHAHSQAGLQLHPSNRNVTREFASSIVVPIKCDMDEAHNIVLVGANAR